METTRTYRATPRYLLVYAGVPVACGAALIATAPSRLPAALVVAMLLTMHFVVRLRPALATNVEATPSSVRVRTPTDDVEMPWASLLTASVERGPRGDWLRLFDGAREVTVFVGHLDGVAIREALERGAPEAYRRRTEP